MGNLALQDSLLSKDIKDFSIFYICVPTIVLGFPGGTSGKEPTCQYGRLLTVAVSIPGSRRSPGGGHGNPLQYSCLKNPHGQRSLVGYTVHRISKSQTRLKQLSMHTCRFNVVYVGFSCRGHLFLSIIL